MIGPAEILDSATAAKFHEWDLQIDEEIRQRAQADRAQAPQFWLSP